MSRFSALANSSRMVTLGMAFAQLGKGLLSLYVLVLSASLFGAGIDRDAWVLGWGVQLFFFKLCFGPVNEIIRARFIHLQEEKGREYALRSVSALLVCVVVVSVVLVLGLYAGSAQVARFFAPGIRDAAGQQKIRQMICLLLPNLLIGELITLFTALLNVFRSFILPEVMAVGSLVLNILLLLFAAPYLGIYTLVLSNYLSAAVLLVLLFLALRRRQLVLTPVLPSWALVKPYLLFALPFYISYTAGQLNTWAERAMATYLGIGHTTVLDYARKFIDLPLTVVISIAVSVMTPLLASLWVRGQKEDFRKEFFVLFRMCLLLLFPVVVLFLVCPRELVSFFLYRGKFDQAWLAPAARTLFCFGCALPGVALYILSGQVLVVKKKVTIYAALGVLTQLLPVGLNLAGYQRYGLPFFAVSWGLAHLCSGLLMSVIGGIWERKQLLGLLRMCGVFLLSLLACRLFYDYVQALSPLMVLVSVMLCCGLSLLLLLYVFRMRELDTLKRKLKTVFHSPEHE